MEFLFTLFIILVLTKVAGHFCSRMGIPSVVGDLLIGIIIGPALLGWVLPTTFLLDFAEIGVILLMFMAGLESDLGILKKYMKPSIIVATSSVFVPITLCFAIGMLWGFVPENALFLGLLFGATSLSISVQVLKEYKKLDSKEGVTILGAAVLDDVLVVILLNIVISMFDENSATYPLWLLLTKKIVFFIIIFIAYKWLVPTIMRLSEKMLSSEAVIAAGISICLLFAYFADFMGMAAIIGAFFAGIAVGQTKSRKIIDEKIEAVSYALFVPVFFVSIGLNMTFVGINEHITFILVLTLIAVLSKLIGGGLGAKLSGFSWSSATIIGAGLVSRGEMALIISKLGLDSSLLSNEYYSSIIMVIILTTIIAPFFLKYTIIQQNKN